MEKKDKKTSVIGILIILLVLSVFVFFLYSTKKSIAGISLKNAEINKYNQTNLDVNFIEKKFIIFSKKTGSMDLSSSSVKKIELIKLDQAILKKTQNKEIKFATDIVAVQTQNASSAQISLQKYSEVNLILYCSDWIFENSTCALWQETNISFTQNQTHITFNVPHFSAYAGGWVNLSVNISQGGIFDKTQINNSKISLLNDSGSTYYANGTYTNQIDAGQLVIWDRISFNAVYVNYTGSEIYVGSNLSTGLVGLWHLNNDSAYGESATKAVDSSGYGNNGTISGGASWNESGRLSGVYRFDGVNGVVNMGDIELVTGNKMTVQAWIKTSTIPQYIGIVCKNYNVAAYYLGGDYGGSTNKVQFHVAGGAGFALSNVALNDNNWHHIVGVYDGSLGSANVKLYVDGVLQSTTGNSIGNIPDSTDNLAIGAESGSSTTAYYYTGLVDDVAIWNRSLSASEVNNIFRGGSIKYQVATSDDNSTWSQFMGPDKINLSYYLDSNQQLNLFNSRFLKYRFYLSTNDTTKSPSITNISVKYFYPITPNGTGTTNNASLKIWDDSEGNLFFSNPSMKFYANFSDFVTGGPIGRETQPKSDLLLLMHFNNNSGYGESGSVVHDFSSESNNGSVSSTALWNNSLGIFGGSYYFAGGIVSVPNKPYFDIPAGTSISVWIYPTDLSSYRDILATYNPGWTLYLNGGGKVYFYSNSVGDALSTSEAISANVWHHIVVTRSGNDWTLYVDGISKSQNTFIPTTSSNSLCIGGRGYGTFIGYIDELSFWNKTLSASEVLTLNNSRNSKPCIITENSSGAWSTPEDMLFNSTSNFYESVLSISGGQSSTFNVSCNGTSYGYTYLTASDSFSSMPLTILNVWSNSTNIGKYPNATVKFFANFSNYTSGVGINGTNTNCSLIEDSSGSWTDGFNMPYNSTSKYYELIYASAYSKNSQFSVTCNGTSIGYDISTKTGTFSAVRASFLGAWYNSTNVGTYPNATVKFFANFTGLNGTLIGGETNSDPTTLLLMHFNNNSDYGESGSVVHDFSSESNNGSVVSTALWNDTFGVFGGSYYFAGGIISVPNKPYFDIPPGTSMSVWIYAKDTTAYRDIVATYNPGWTLYLFNGGRVYFYSVAIGDAMYSAEAIATDRWYHIAVTRSGNDWILYLNGTQISQNTFGSATSSNPLTIAGRSSSGTYIGYIDELSFWNKTLSASEVKALYEKEVMGMCKVSERSFGSWSTQINMSFNDTSKLYEALVPVAYAQNTQFNVTCNGSGYDYDYLSSIGLFDYFIQAYFKTWFVSLQNGNYPTGITRFYANYSKQSDSLPINGTNITCIFLENSLGSWSQVKNMTFNEASSLYEFNISVNTKTNGLFNITCDGSSGYFSKEGVIDSFWYSVTRLVFSQKIFFNKNILIKT